MLDRFRQYREQYGESLKIIGWLNLAYLFSSVGDRLWAFSMGLIMHQLGGLSWVAIHQLVEAFFKLALASTVGDILDKTNRSKGIQMILAVNNVCITIAAFIFYLMYSGVGGIGENRSILLLGTAIIFDSISRVASEAQKTAFTKDWIVVLIENSNGVRLSTQNTIMNMIDQGAAFIAPFIGGSLLEYHSGAICCIAIIIWNIVSWSLEAGVLLWVYSHTPELSVVRELSEAEKAMSPFRKYWRQKAFRAMFGLALLYMTVLGFDNIASSYGISQGMTPTQIGAFRSVGSILGFLGNASYALIERNVGVLITGLIGLIIQNIFINFCSTSVFLPGNPFNATGYINSLNSSIWFQTVKENIVHKNPPEAVAVSGSFITLSPSILAFFFGITFARFGLWIADPAITQIMQESIPEAERYSVYAAQNVLCSFFSICKDILVVLFPTSQTFGVLIIISTMFVFAGFLFYLSYFLMDKEKDKIASDVEMKEIAVPIGEKVIDPLVDNALKSA